jgi:hypothetical protein
MGFAGQITANVPKDVVTTSIGDINDRLRKIRDQLGGNTEMIRKFLDRAYGVCSEDGGEDQPHPLPGGGLLGNTFEAIEDIERESAKQYHLLNRLSRIL